VADMKFMDVVVCRDERFSVGVEEFSGKFYLSIPVANGIVDYEEYYEVDREAFLRYRRDPQSALPFAERCRNRDADDALIIKPGRNRGVAV
jgi:hypothetical protein